MAKDINKTERYFEQIQAGIVSVNNVVSDPHVPFGGVKKWVWQRPI
jgi:acyl-CoA reductase-like NAD-dependent aldehyde dehydrogenase